MLVVRQLATRIARHITAQAAKVVRLHPLGRAGRTRAMIALLALFAIGPVQLSQLGTAGSAAPGVASMAGSTGPAPTVATMDRGEAPDDGRSDAPDGDDFSESPAPGWSQYMVSTNPAQLRRTGCRAGAQTRTHIGPLADVLTVLDFGRPARRHYVFGTMLFGTGGYRSTKDIARGVERYEAGYVTCVRSSRTHLELAIGTSNFGQLVTPGHGRAWAAMVNDVAAWTQANGLGDRVNVDGASDIELAWSGPGRARRWVNAYSSLAEHPYFDYGDAASCPPFGNCLGRWRQEDVWYVAFGARDAIPLPEIYAPNGANAWEWQRLSLFSVQRHGRPIVFAGAMSQREACRQSADPCRGMNNTPRQAWEILARALHSDRRTTELPRWSTDIRWAA
jgi:hypothetical protein